MKPIKLPDVKLLRSRFIYNPETGVLLMQKDGNNQVKAGDVVGHLHKSGYLTVGINGKLYYVHRVIYLLVTGKDPGKYQVDHIDGNRTNNKFENFRLVNNRRNCRNLGNVGVSFYKKSNKWVSRISIDDTRLFLGCFINKEDAIKARHEAEIKYWGEDTNLRRST